MNSAIENQEARSLNLFQNPSEISYEIQKSYQNYTKNSKTLPKRGLGGPGAALGVSGEGLGRSRGGFGSILGWVWERLGELWGSFWHQKINQKVIWFSDAFSGIHFSCFLLILNVF